MMVKKQMMASFGVRKGCNIAVNFFKELIIHGFSMDKKKNKA